MVYKQLWSVWGRGHKYCMHVFAYLLATKQNKGYPSLKNDSALSPSQK